MKKKIVSIVLAASMMITAFLGTDAISVYAADTSAPVVSYSSDIKIGDTTIPKWNESEIAVDNEGKYKVSIPADCIKDAGGSVASVKVGFSGTQDYPVEDLKNNVIKMTELKLDGSSYVGTVKISVASKAQYVVLYVLVGDDSGNYSSTVFGEIKINYTQTAPKIKVKKSTYKVSAGKVKKAGKKVSLSGMIESTAPVKNVKKVSGDSAIKIKYEAPSVGTVAIGENEQTYTADYVAVVKKGTKAGTYKVKLKVVTDETVVYKKAEKTITIKIVVK